MNKRLVKKGQLKIVSNMPLSILANNAIEIFMSIKKNNVKPFKNNY